MHSMDAMVFKMGSLSILVCWLQKGNLHRPRKLMSTQNTESPVRITVVIEYPSKDAVPGIGRNPRLGGVIMAVQFNDALKELSVMTETLELLSRGTLTSTQYDMIDAALTGIHS